MAYDAVPGEALLGRHVQSAEELQAEMNELGLGHLPLAAYRQTPKQACCSAYAIINQVLSGLVNFGKKQSKANQIKSNQSKSNQIKSNQIKTNQNKTNQNKTNKNKTNQNKHVNSQTDSLKMINHMTEASPFF